MSDESSLFPTGLTRSQFERISSLTEEGAERSVESLRSDVQTHLQRTRAAHERNRVVNLRLATAIASAVDVVLAQWEQVDPESRNWLAGAILYFANCNDDEPDFDSPLGFEDDTEVLNACLRFANLDELCLKPEDYDDA